jgi:hypothetical protein
VFANDPTFQYETRDQAAIARELARPTAQPLAIVTITNIPPYLEDERATDLDA